MSDGHVADSDRTAGIVSRGVAAFIDTVVVAVILGIGYLSVVAARLILSVRDFTFPSASVVFTATGFVVVAILYLAACWAVSGRTAGSVLMGLRVVNHRGERVRAPVALARAALSALFAIGLAWCAVDRRRRSVADVVFRTRVVYSR